MPESTNNPTETTVPSASVEYLTRYLAEWQYEKGMPRPRTSGELPDLFSQTAALVALAAVDNVEFLIASQETIGEIVCVMDRAVRAALLVPVHGLEVQQFWTQFFLTHFAAEAID